MNAAPAFTSTEGQYPRLRGNSLEALSDAVAPFQDRHRIRERLLATDLAQLLDALRGGKAGDTVRSVIERLTGGGARPVVVCFRARPASE